MNRSSSNQSLKVNDNKHQKNDTAFSPVPQEVEKALVEFFSLKKLCCKP